MKDNRIRYIKFEEDYIQSTKNLASKLPEVDQLLLSLKITPNNLGYNYIKHSALSLIEYMRVGQRVYITKDIYPTVARTYLTTVSRVERAMRHSIATSYDKMHDTYNDLFGGKPTNGEFIHTLATLLVNNQNGPSSIDAVG